ncbi:bifunctional (p)ppGpp synthetase/guanosine-3',5'-bis(diphosphate) 3'-pyrophosphohydrolase [Candidatus Parcubacteria bacterium]|nr:bifunctional (p)ppGpp synthetase/guanosine-3',5'-bis(diphosphate) 3'-pyrophosphohydrolase [Candidatus Parcubacteria bacterium]
MNHTPQIKKAIQFAARKHHGQLRKETEPLPYITHPFSVALLVAEDGADDDIVAAALLHDTLEDTDTTCEEIIAAFNERVAALVESVSERKERDGKELNWKERKLDYLARLEHTNDGAVLISLADKIDNIESKMEAYAAEGEALLKRWPRPLEEYLWFHGEVLRIGQVRLPKHRLTARLTEAYAREREVFAEE